MVVNVTGRSPYFMRCHGVSCACFATPDEITKAKGINAQAANRRERIHHFIATRRDADNAMIHERYGTAHMADTHGRIARLRRPSSRAMQ